MVLVPCEKRFGPDFDNGQREEPSVHTYNVPDMGKKEKPGSKKGFLPKAKRLNPEFDNKLCMGSASPGPLQYATANKPGCFAPAFTTEQLSDLKKKLRPVRDFRPPKQPSVHQTDTFSQQKLHLALGPGSYMTSIGVNKPETKTNKFGKQKRMNMIDFQKMMGKHGFDLGPGFYNMSGHEMSKLIMKRPDMATVIAREKSNEDLLNSMFESLEMKKSRRRIRQSYQKISHSLGKQEMKKMFERFEKIEDANHPSPWKYDKQSNFTTKKQTQPTFGKEKRPDMLESLLAAGLVSNTETGPGMYETSNTFASNTKNVRGGYKPSSPALSNLGQIEIPLAPKSELFGEMENKTVDYKLLLKQLMRSPAPSSLRSSERQKPKSASTSKTSQPALTESMQEARGYSSDDFESDASKSPKRSPKKKNMKKTLTNVQSSQPSPTNSKQEAHGYSSEDFESDASLSPKKSPKKESKDPSLCKVTEEGSRPSRTSRFAEKRDDATREKESDEKSHAENALEQETKPLFIHMFADSNADMISSDPSSSSHRPQSRMSTASSNDSRLGSREYRIKVPDRVNSPAILDSTTDGVSFFSTSTTSNSTATSS